MPYSTLSSGIATRRTRGLAALTVLGLSVVFASSAFADGAAPLQTVAQPILPVVSRSINLGPVDPATVIQVSVSLKPSNVAAMNAFADSVSDPNSPNYLNFITPKEFGVRFGQPTTTFQSAVDYLKSQGFKITLAGDNNLTISATGTVAQAEKAFNTQLNRYHAIDAKVLGRQDFIANATAPSLPKGIAEVTQYVGGLETFVKPMPRTTQLSPAQTRTLYNGLPIYSAGYTGAGRTIGISNWDGFRLSNVPIFYSTFGLPTPAGGAGSNITVKAFNGGSGSGPAGAEGDLDIQLALGQAPLASMIVYDGVGTTQGLLDVLGNEANDNLCDVISESYGWALSAGAAENIHNLHVQMTTQGTTYLIASGDNGTDELLNTSFWYPTIDPDVLVVGGTDATTDRAGKRQSEPSWSGSGGGYCTISTTFNVRPSWQKKGNGIPASPNYRLAPDIAAHATSYSFVYGGAVNGVGGTSCSSPAMAGDLVILEQQLLKTGGLGSFPNGKRRLGRLNDKIYGQNGRSDVWFDVTTGPGNGQLPDGSSTSVTTGWDYVTGWGAIDWAKFGTTFALAAPVTLVPSSVGIYANQGTNLLGSAGNLAAANDNSFVTLGTVNQTGTGAVATVQVNFSTTKDLTKLAAAQIVGSVKVPTQATGYVYALNYATNSYDQLGTISGNGAYSTFTYTPSNAANYFNASKQAVILVRGLMPSRLGAVPFTLSVDQVNIILGF